MTIPAAPAFTFDEATHAYRLGDQIMPSVTEVISAAGLVDYSAVPPETLEWARQRGTLLHKAAALWDRDELDEDTVDPEILVRLEAWKQFRYDTGFRPKWIEKSLHGHSYAGTFDRVGTVRLPGEDMFPLLRREKMGGALATDPDQVRHRTHWLVDIKPWQAQPATGVQLAAYQRLISSWIGQQCERISVHLRADGRYRIKTYPARELEADFQTFLAALRIYQWRRLHKV